MKKMLKGVMAAAMSLAVAVSSAPVVSAEEGTALEAVQQKLGDASSALQAYLKETIAAPEYVPSYNDYADALYCIKATTMDGALLQQMDDALKQQMAAYQSGFLNPQASEGVQSYALAVSILYLEERNVNVADYEGKNLVSMLKETFLQEAAPNPYAYAFVDAVMRNEGDADAAVQNKIKEGVLGYYVSSEVSGSGIDYWGVSVDNNGAVLTALAGQAGSDADIKTKADAALAWNKAQMDASGAIVSWGNPNANSTAMALRAAAQFGALEDAALYYQALTQFESATTKGAYTYEGADSVFSTRDALTGMLAYASALQGIDLYAVRTRYDIDDPVVADPGVTPEPTAAPQETKAPEASQQPSQTTVPSAAPKTGDHADMTGLVCIMVLAAAAAIVLWSRKNEEREYR